MIIKIRNPTPDEMNAELQAERIGMTCSPMQGRLAFGEAEWAKVQAYYDTHATWTEKVVIDSSGAWKRTSENIAFFQYLLDYSDEQVDDLFRLAATIEA